MAAPLVRIELLCAVGFVLATASFVSAQQCKKVYDTSVHCLEDSEMVEMSCPPDHKIEIQDAQYLVSSSPDCPESHDPSDCSLGALTGMFGRECHSAGNECQIKVVKKSDTSVQSICQGQIGSQYVGVKYTCEGNSEGSSTIVKALSLCEQEPLYTGSMVRIKSHQDAENGLTTSLGCHCTISVQRHLEIQIERLEFEMDQTPSLPCEQKIVFSADSQAVEDVEICPRDWNKQNDGNYLNCYEKGQLVVSYDKKGKNDTAVSFILEAKVHPTENFTIQCGFVEGQQAVETLDMPIAGAAESEDESTLTNMNYYIIGACLGAAALIAVAVVIILTRRRNSQKGDSDSDSESGGSTNGFVKNIYLDDGVSAKQVVTMDKHREEPLHGNLDKLPEAPIVDPKTDQSVKDIMWNANI